ncbi:MAG: hypothetical protein ACI38Q_04030 [Candidatus Bruticola sp.]
MILSTYIFPVGLGAWTSFSLLVLLSLFLALKAALSPNSLLSCAYAGGFMMSLGLLYFYLDLPYAAGLQIFLSAGPASLLLLFAAVHTTSDTSPAPLNSPNNQRKKWAAAAALLFFAANSLAVLLSSPFLNDSFPVPASTEIFSHTDYAFFLEDYASLDNWTAVVLSICCRYPYLAALLSVTVSALLVISCRAASTLLTPLTEKKGN